MLYLYIFHLLNKFDTRSALNLSRTRPSDKNGRVMNQNTFAQGRAGREMSEPEPQTVFKIHCRCVMIKHGYAATERRRSPLSSPARTLRSTICQTLFCGRFDLFPFRVIFSRSTTAPDPPHSFYFLFPLDGKNYAEPSRKLMKALRVNKKLRMRVLTK